MKTHARRRMIQLVRNTGIRVGVMPSLVTARTEIDRFMELLTPHAVEQPLIRLGAVGDGGYIVPDDLDGRLAAVSPGVAFEVSFDLALAERGIDVEMLDASVPGPPIPHERFRFRRLFLDSYESASTTTLDAVVGDLPPDSYDDLILEMDIEGAEYRVIHSMSPATAARFRIIVVELHDLDDLASRSRFADINAALEKLLKTHRVVHVHMNNSAPSVRLGRHRMGEVVEVTLHRRDRSIETGRRVTLPHPLDVDCSPETLRIPVPELWR